MDKKKVLVCGASGFIGRHITEYLSGNDALEVTGVYLNSEPPEIRNINMISADLTDTSDVAAIVAGKDVIIQAAATTCFPGIAACWFLSSAPAGVKGPGSRSGSRHEHIVRNTAAAWPGTRVWWGARFLREFEGRRCLHGRVVPLHSRPSPCAAEWRRKSRTHEDTSNPPHWARPRTELSR